MASKNHQGQQKLRLAGFLLNFAELDRAIELNRQALTCGKGFEPYSAFQRLAQGSDTPMSITPGALDEFLRDQGLNSDRSALETLVNVYGSKLAGMLDFEDFLRLVLAREAADARFEAARREVPDGGEVSPLTEFLLARLLARVADCLRRLKVDPETQTLLADSGAVFGQLGGRQLDFGGLQAFFRTAGVTVPDKDVLAILRILDVNDDGVVDRNEMEYFLSIMNVRHHSGAAREAIAAKIKVKARVVEAEEIGMKRTRDAREELRGLAQVHSAKVQKGERNRKSNNFFNETRELREVEKITRKEEPTYQRYERTYVREEKRESPPPPRSISKSVEAIVRERKTKREDGYREIQHSHAITETPILSRTYNYTPKARTFNQTDEEFFVSGFRALKPLHHDEEVRQEYRRNSAMNTLSKESNQIKRSTIEESRILESPIFNTRTPTKNVSMTDDRRIFQSKENLRKTDRDASATKSANRLIKESIRTEEIIRQPRETEVSHQRAEFIKQREGYHLPVGR